jgi:tetratricopeptide (TPR) repeat protein
MDPAAARTANAGVDGTKLLRRALDSDDPVLLDAAVERLRAAVAQQAAVGGVPLSWLANLGAALRTRYDRGGDGADLVDLTEAVGLLRLVVDHSGARHAELSGRLSNLGLALRDRFERQRDMSDLDEALAVLQRAVDAAGEHQFVRAASNLSLALLDRYEFTRAPSDVDGAVDTARRAVGHPGPATASDRAAALANLAGALLARARGSEDIDGAVAAARSAVEATALGHPKRPARLAAVGIATFRRYELRGEIDDLNETIAILSSAAVPGPSVGASTLAGALCQRYRSLGDPADLDAATDKLRSAIAQTPPDSSDLPGRLSNLAIVLGDVADRDGSSELLDEAMELHERAMELAGTGHPDMLSVIFNRAAGLQSRFAARGAMDDLTAAVDAARAALRLCGAEHAQRPRYLGQLGRLLAGRHRVTGAEVDLHEAVTLLRQAVDQLSPGHPDRSTVCSGLAAALIARYVRFGADADLDEAISWHATAAALPSAVVGRAGRLASGAYALRLRAERTRLPGDIDAAVAAGRAAVAAAVGVGGRARLLAALGSALDLRGESAADLDETITVRRQVLAHCGPDEPMYGLWTADLANSLRNRARSSGRRADLDEAVRLHVRALELTAPAHPEYATVLTNLAGSLRDRYIEEGDDGDLVDSLRHLRAAAELPTAPAGRRLVAAETWARLATDTGRPAAALDGFIAAVGVLPAAAWRGSGRTAREQLLRQAPWLAADAAATALRMDRPELALDLLEQGRTVLWNQRLETATDLDVLREHAPDLAERLDAARAVLDWADDAGDHGEARIAAAAEWDAAVRQVQQQPEPELAGLFGAAPQIATRLRAAKLPGAVAVVTVSSIGCDAILADHSGVRSFRLVRLDLDQLADNVGSYLAALEVLATEDRDARLAADADIGRVLRWLGDAVIDPVLAELGPVDRVWWCPTGPLTYLPLHAAGTAVDGVVSSYTPTLGALLRPYLPGPEPSVVGVAVPESPGLPPLGGAVQEVEELAAALSPGPVPFTRLVGMDATTDAVRTALHAHTWAHLACHGAQDLVNPAHGALLLCRGQLRVTDLVTRQAYHADGAYLSACQTALGGVQLQDEALHLAAALQYAGFRQVIATLWPVGDMRARLTANEVYTALTADGGFSPASAAHAVHAVVNRLRQRFPDHPSVWAPYVHIGQ